MNLGVSVAVMEALGGTVELDVRPPTIPEGRRLRDPVHARVMAYSSRRLDDDGWAVRQEVEIRSGRAIGWIDILAFRERDRAVLVGEAKSDVLDIGGAQRQLNWYIREAWAAARSIGWRPASVTSALILLDTAHNAKVLSDHHELFRQAFPARASELLAALRGIVPLPRGPALAMVDPLSRRDQWLRSTPSDGRRSPSRYANYAAFLETITRRTERRTERRVPSG